MIRNTAVQGTFYPRSCEEINKQINHFSNILENSDFDSNLDFTPKAIIVPHAGYIYSGFTANAAYSLLKNLEPKRVVVIGPSHKFGFEGASVALLDEYASPCGNIPIDTQYSENLIYAFDFLDFNQKVHCEHSTETQIPFIKHYLPNTKIVEIIYSDISYKQITQIVAKALKEEDTFLVISTDLSHFYDLQKANELDSIGLVAVDKLDLDIWNSGCEACGRTGVKALIQSANDFKLQSKLLDYRTSFDMTKDDKSVVGYMSAVLG